MNSCVESILDAFAADLRENGKSDRTIKTYGYVLGKFAQWLQVNGGGLEQMTRFDVQSYITHLQDNSLSATTINKVFAAISTFCQFTDRSQAVQNVRLPEVRKLRNIAPKSLERNVRNRVLREVERDGNLRDIAILYTLLLTGLRVSELVALDLQDVAIKERSGSVVVRSGKGNVARKVPLSAEVRLHLGQYLATRTDNLEALFLSNYRQRISVRTVQHMASKYGIHPHQLRHTFCHDLVGSGVDIATVAELAGHADINVTRRMPSRRSGSWRRPSRRRLRRARHST